MEDSRTAGRTRRFLRRAWKGYLVATTRWYVPAPWVLAYGAAVGMVFLLNAWYVDDRASRSRQGTQCHPPASPYSAPIAAEAIGLPPSSATLTPKMGSSHDHAVASVSWQSGPSTHEAMLLPARASVLLREDGSGEAIPSTAAVAWVNIDAGTTVLHVCFRGPRPNEERDSTRPESSARTDSVPLADLVKDQEAVWADHGRFEGFLVVPTSDSARSITVRAELSVQSGRAWWIWPSALVLVPFALALSSSRLETLSKTARWLVAATAVATLAATYWSAVLSDADWAGDFEAVSRFLAAAFTATTGAVTGAVAAAAGGQRDGAAERPGPPPPQPTQSSATT